MPSARGIMSLISATRSAIASLSLNEAGEGLVAGVNQDCGVDDFFTARSTAALSQGLPGQLGTIVTPQ